MSCKYTRANFLKKYYLCIKKSRIIVITNDGSVNFCTSGPTPGQFTFFEKKWLLAGWKKMHCATKLGTNLGLYPSPWVMDVTTVVWIACYKSTDHKTRIKLMQHPQPYNINPFYSILIGIINCVSSTWRSCPMRCLYFILTKFEWFARSVEATACAFYSYVASANPCQGSFLKIYKRGKTTSYLMAFQTYIRTERDFKSGRDS